MRLEKIIYEIQKKDTKRKLSNFIKKLWNEEKIDELLLLIDIDINVKLKLDHVPEFDEPEDGESKFRFNDFFKLISLLKKCENNDQKKELIENSALDCNEIIWNNLYRKVLLNQLNSVIDIDTIIKTIQKLVKEK